MAKTDKENNSNSNNSIESPVEKLPICGIIMPIANTPGYPDGHWNDVYSILCEVAQRAGFEANMVSFDDDIGVIHKRIIQNIYHNPIVICDISSRNSNVMFELGMRLAFDKPTIIVKDKLTPFSFDISSIEHLEYPSDLRYQSINEFKLKLESKIAETYKRSLSDPEFSTFLKQFGTFTISRLDEKEAGFNEVLLEEFKELKKSISIQMNRNNRTYIGEPLATTFSSNDSNEIVFKRVGIGNKGREILTRMIELNDVHGTGVPLIRSIGDDMVALRFEQEPSKDSIDLIRAAMRKV